MSYKAKQPSTRSRLRNNDIVKTPDGQGVVIGRAMRKNTNGGPGCEEYVVRLTLTGQVRHYSRGDVSP